MGFLLLFLFFLWHGSFGLLVHLHLIDFGEGSSCCSCCDRGTTKSTPSPKTEIWTLELGLEFDNKIELHWSYVSLGGCSYVGLGCGSQYPPKVFEMELRWSLDMPFIRGAIKVPEIKKSTIQNVDFLIRGGGGVQIFICFSWTRKCVKMTFRLS